MITRKSRASGPAFPCAASAGAGPLEPVTTGRLGYHGAMRFQMPPGRELKFTRSRILSADWWLAAVTRFWPVIAWFALAFAIDRITGQQYSPVLGSTAILGSLWTVFPAVRPTTLVLGAYALIWVAFNLVRAVADDIGLALTSATTVSSIESALFDGTLPAQRLQDRFHDPQHLQAHDLALALVHASFFVVPFLVGLALWWKRRPMFMVYGRATAVAFGFGLLGFVLAPTAPPWLSEPESVTRVTTGVLSALFPGESGPSAQDPRLGFEPNHIAALPSVHVAAAVLVFLAWRRTISPSPGTALAPLAALAALAALAYPLAMTVAVVYLGEHFILDAVLGWVVALLAWRLAIQSPGRTGRQQPDG